MQTPRMFSPLREQGLSAADRRESSRIGGPIWSPTGPIQAARIGILLAARKPTHRVRRLHYSAGTSSASLGALPNAMIFERPATAIAVSV
jgi:hypothetical protein